MGGEFGQRTRVELRPQPRLAPARVPDPAGHSAASSRISIALYVAERSLHEIDFDYTGFQWIDCNDNENSVISFIRRARDSHDFVVALMNFTPVPRDGYRIGVPEPGGYSELINSDAAIYGGSNSGNGGVIFSRADRLARPPAVAAPEPAAVGVPAAEAGEVSRRTARGLRDSVGACHRGTGTSPDTRSTASASCCAAPSRGPRPRPIPTLRSATRRRRRRRQSPCDRVSSSFQ